MPALPKFPLLSDNVKTSHAYNSLRFPFVIKSGDQDLDIKPLIDSGAQFEFINRTWISQHKPNIHKLKRPIRIFNIDGTENKGKEITHTFSTNIRLKNKVMPLTFLITDLAREDFVLGYNWLKTYQPNIDWKNPTLTLLAIHL